jgi:hypothetical protein
MGNMGEVCAETALSAGASPRQVDIGENIPSVAFVLRSACNSSHVPVGQPNAKVST